MPGGLVLTGSAFGGGAHPTTAACLELLASLGPLDGLAVLDLGSGSGILALSALRGGAARATCVDVNPEAVACAARNGEVNGLAGRLEHRLGSFEAVAGERYDLLLANIGGELLLDHAARIAPLGAPGARLILSGVLAGWAEELADAYVRHGCTLLERRELGGFCTLLLRREDDPAGPPPDGG
jgi:ribosomal protein L11 methyltransferase